MNLSAKKFILCMCAFQIAASISSSSHAQSNFQDNTSINKGDTLAYYPSESVGDDLASQLCGMISSSTASPKEAEAILLNNFNLSQDTPNYKHELAQLWNAHSHMVICLSPDNEYPIQHYFKRVVMAQMQEPLLKDYFFYDENEFPIDPNIIEKHPVSGNTTTLLDFLNSIIEGPQSKGEYNYIQLKGLRTILVDYYGAKTFAEIAKEQKSKGQ